MIIFITKLNCLAIDSNVMYILGDTQMPRNIL